MPPQFTRVASNKTKYIKSLLIEKKSEYDEEIWFEDLTIDFNHGLIAIIGNKGMGKSALADILGLLGNSQRGEHFSFLHRDKFLGRDRSKGKAKKFAATLQWESAITEQRGLEEQISAESSELVRYVPQNFFEKICNETELKSGGEFTQELEKIIFSHVEDYKKQGCMTLKELIDQQTEEIERIIDNLKAELSTINRDIEDKEYQLSQEYRQNIFRDIKKKEGELKTLEQNPPAEVSQPEAESENTKQLEQIREDGEQLKSNVTKTTNMQRVCEQKLTALSKLEESIGGFERQHINWVKSSTDEIKLLEINHGQLLTVSFHYKKLLESKKVILQAEAEKLAETRNEQKSQETTLDQRDVQLRRGLTDGVQRYENYQTELSKWETEKQNTEKEIQTLNDRFTFLEKTLPNQHVQLQADRQKIAVDIFLQKIKLADVYQALYKPVQDFIKNHSLVKNKYRLGFDVAIDIKNDFPDSFFGLIKQNVTGTYYGKEPGRRKLEEKMEGRHFDQKNDIVSFLNDIISSLENNEQIQPYVKVDLKAQLKKKTISEFYDFLFGLDYLEPRYSLQLDGKELLQLSPGERGILLLIFYLLIDKEDCPLIIDQPEENLDNQSVFELLVPCVEEAKMRRQIFLVTHNPNLAVVCDADQIVHAQIDKLNGNRVEYSAGSIENPEINKKVVDILEGTWLAFRKRESMYQITTF